jgi:SHS2 domain-containing protein
MENPESSGFRDVDHTADVALDVWAPDLQDLFIQAAFGMYHLMNIQYAEKPGVLKHFNFSAPDQESLLVRFLSEVLFSAESERVAFDPISLEISGKAMELTVTPRPILFQTRSVKAVTFHNLSIRLDPGRYSVTIVFDV